MAASLTHGVRALSPEPQTVQATKAKPQAPANLLVAQGRVFRPLADALPLFSLDLVGLVAQYKLDELLIAVEGDLAKLSPHEKAAIRAASQDVKFLDLGQMALTTRNGLQLQEALPNLETIIERGKMWSWNEWLFSEHPVEGVNEAPISPANAWAYTCLVREMFQISKGFEGDVKEALLGSEFYTWYITAPDNAPLLKRLRGQDLHPIQHRLASLFLLKLAPFFKSGRTKPMKFRKHSPEMHIQLKHKSISGLEIGPLEYALIKRKLLLKPEEQASTKRVPTMVDNITCEILKLAKNVALISKLPLSEEEIAAITELLTLFY